MNYINNDMRINWSPVERDEPVKDCVIRTRALTCMYGADQGVRDIYLSVPRGSIYGFVGKNGAGKTTVIRMLLSLQQAQSGDIYLFNRPLSSDRDVLAQVGSLVEEPAVYPHLSGYRNLLVACRYRRVPVKRIIPLLNQLHLGVHANRAVRTYSMGMRQRLGLALALLHDPDLLILDEPTNGLDPDGIDEFREMLNSLTRDRGITVFMSSHLLSAMEQLVTHVGILHNNKLVFEGDMGVLRAQGDVTLWITCNVPKKALAVLSCLTSIEASLQSNKVAVCLPSKDLPRLFYTLYDNGIDVVDLAMQKGALESFFLKLARSRSS